MDTRVTRHPVMLATVLAVLLSACPAPQEEPEPDPDPGLSTGPGVTAEPCPEAVNPDNGCIYLGVVSDLDDGPFAERARPLTAGQQAFWVRVNDAGGMGGFDVDVTTFVADSGSDPRVHAERYHEMRHEVLALAQSYGAAQTGAILDDLADDDMVAVATSRTSAWAFSDHVIQSGASYCIEALNAVDVALEALSSGATVMAVHHPGDYGDDAAAGAALAADAHGGQFTSVLAAPEADGHQAITDSIVDDNPDILYVATGPLELATIVGQAAARGYQGAIIGAGPTWDRQLLDTPAGPALRSRYTQAAAWGPWDTDSVGHAAMREALEAEAPDEAAVAGWIGQYPLKAAITEALAHRDLTRQGLRAALEDLAEVDFEGMLPAHGPVTGAPHEVLVRRSVLNRVDVDAPTGLSVDRPHFAASTTERTELTRPCFEQ